MGCNNSANVDCRMTLGRRVDWNSPVPFRAGLGFSCFNPMPHVATTVSTRLDGAVFAVSRLPLPVDRASPRASSIQPASKGVSGPTTNGVMSAEVNCSPRAMRRSSTFLKIGLSFCSNAHTASGAASREVTHRMCYILSTSSPVHLSGERRVFACVIARQRPDTACSSNERRMHQTGS